MKKLLLIEDDLPLARMYKTAFQKRSGYEFFHGKDGEEGIKLAKAEKPDLILLDLVLPKKSGFEVLKELKADAVTAKIPVVCLSVLHQDEDFKKCQDLGAVGYFVKSDILPGEIVTRILARLS